MEGLVLPCCAHLCTLETLTQGEANWVWICAWRQRFDLVNQCSELRPSETLRLAYLC